jgi:histidinol dehydrogenase
MNVVPAQAAGVASLVVASPPQQENGGLPDARVLAACALLGVDEVYAVGGAQAIAMLGYGSAGRAGSAESAGAGDVGHCEPVDVITGPGNIWVTAAKRLVTDSPALVEAVEAELARQVPATKHEARVREALTGEQSGVVLVDDLEQGLRVVDAYAAEHLEIQTRDAREWAMRVRNAGAIFVGAWSPVSLGDYAAGSNHVLPTGGCARHSSGLSVQSFLRGIHVVEYDEAALRDVARHVVTLANVEDLPAHGQAVTARFGGVAP